jgi:hypothetical protein
MQHLAAQYATAARLYAEAVVLLTADSLHQSWDDYDYHLQKVEEAARRVKAADVALQEHVDRHRSERDLSSRFRSSA